MASNILHGALPWFSAGVRAPMPRGRAVLRGKEETGPARALAHRPGRQRGYVLSLRQNLWWGLNGLTRLHISVA